MQGRGLRPAVMVVELKGEESTDGVIWEASSRAGCMQDTFACCIPVFFSTRTSEFL